MERKYTQLWNRVKAYVAYEMKVPLLRGVYFYEKIKNKPYVIFHDGAVRIRVDRVPMNGERTTPFLKIAEITKKRADSRLAPPDLSEDPGVIPESEFDVMDEESWNQLKKNSGSVEKARKRKQEKNESIGQRFIEELIRGEKPLVQDIPPRKKNASPSLPSAVEGGDAEWQQFGCLCDVHCGENKICKYVEASDTKKAMSPTPMVEGEKCERVREGGGKPVSPAPTDEADIGDAYFSKLQMMPADGTPAFQTVFPSPEAYEDKLHAYAKSTEERLAKKRIEEMRIAERDELEKQEQTVDFEEQQICFDTLCEMIGI